MVIIMNKAWPDNCLQSDGLQTDEVCRTSLYVMVQKLALSGLMCCHLL